LPYLTYYLCVTFGDYCHRQAYKIGYCGRVTNLKEIIMIKKIFLSLSFLLVAILPATAEQHHIQLKKEAAIGNLAHVTSVKEWLYITGQPDQQTIKSLKAHGFDMVINIRGKDEVTFDEKALVESSGLIYVNHPLLQDGKIQDSAVEKIHEIIAQNKGKKILFHCSSGNRAAAWFGAHLVRDMGYDTEKAIDLAKQAGMTKDSMAVILRDYIRTLGK